MSQWIHSYRTVQHQLDKSHDSKEFYSRWKWNDIICIDEIRLEGVHHAPILKPARAYWARRFLSPFFQQFSWKIYCFLRQWADTRENKPVNHDHDCNSHIQFYWYDVFGIFFLLPLSQLLTLMPPITALCFVLHVKCNLSYFLFIKKMTLFAENSVLTI